MLFVFYRLIEKLVVNFLLVTTELFFARSITTEALPANINWKLPFMKRGEGSFWPKFQVEGDVPHQPFIVHVGN